MSLACSFRVALRRHSPLAAIARRLAPVACLVALSACAGAQDRGAEFNDPYERTNRKVHAFNIGLDRALLKPSSRAYGSAVPGPVRTGVSNFAGNLGLPSIIVNDMLQGRLEPAGHNAMRLLVNTTFGVAGLLDPATDMGLHEKSTDFGETLHVWGAAEGPYVELPVFGPSTARDAVGTLVDAVTDPVGAAVGQPEATYVLGAGVLSKIGDRYRYSDTIDSILYDSADSYAQARLLYLQNRRFELGAETEAEAYDPYQDPYGQ